MTKEQSNHLHRLRSLRPSKALLASYLDKGFALVPFRVAGWDDQRQKWGKLTRYPWRVRGPLRDPADLDQFYQDWYIDSDYSLIAAVLDGSGLMTIDFDAYKDTSGASGLEAYMTEFGGLPKSVVVFTLNGGKHFYFRNTTGALLRQTSVSGSIDVLSSGCVILPDGNHYVIEGISPDQYAAHILEATAPYSIPAVFLEPDQPSNSATKKGAYALEDVRRLLDSMNPCNYANHSDFISISAAVLHACGDSEDVRAALIDFWDRDGAYHGSRENTITQINSLISEKKGKTITANSLFKAAREEGCLTGHLPTIKEKQELRKEAADKRKRERFAAALTDWYYVHTGNFFVCIAGHPYERTRDSFNAQFAHVSGSDNAAAYAFRFDLIKHAERVEYNPGGDKLMFAEGNFPRVNMWRDTRAVPDDSRPYQWFIDHIYRLLDADDAEHFLNWLAYAVQNPGKKIMHAFLIIGRQGSGKSIMYEIMKGLFGAENCTNPHNENLSDRFTSWAKHKCLCFINELKQDGNYHFYNAIKPFISEGDIDIREMRKDPYSIRNTMNIIAFSNESVPIQIDKDDRRWYVANSSALPVSPAYVREFLANCQDNIGGVAHYLLSRDISAFYPGERPAVTAAKQYLIEQSLSDYDQYLSDELESADGILQHDIVCIRDIMENLPREYRDNRYVTAKRTGIILRNIAGAFPVNTSGVTVNGKKGKYLIIRNHSQYMTDGAVNFGIEETVRGLYESAGSTGAFN